jgi:hypothetical protein
MVISKFTRRFDGAHDGCKIVIRADIVAIDHSGILEVRAGRGQFRRQDRPGRPRSHHDEVISLLVIRLVDHFELPGFGTCCTNIPEKC